MKKILINLIAIVLLPVLAQANVTAKCDQLVEHLKQMKKAQLSVHQSLIANHDLIAQSLESYAEALSDSSGRAYKAVEVNMMKSARSLKERGEKGQNVALKLSEQTDELIKIAANCLK